MPSECTAPLISADIEGGGACSDDVHDLDRNDDHSCALPYPFRVLKRIMNISALRPYVYFLYAVSLIVPVVSLYDLYIEFVLQRHDKFGGSLIFLFNVLETGVIVALPYISYAFLVEALHAEDVSELFVAAVSLDSQLHRKFVALSAFNIILVLVSVSVFCVYISQLLVFERVIFALYGTMYLVPFCTMYTLVLCILACHRVLLMSYNSAIATHIEAVQCRHTSIEANTAMALREEYMTLQYFTRTTASRRGFSVYLLFLFSALFVTYVIWSIYWQQFAVFAMISHVLSSLVFLSELGWLLTSVNETGYVISRELSLLLMFSRDIDEPTKRDISIFLQCIQSSPLVIPFFKNAVLRTQTFIAVLGSALGAIIPGLLQY